MVLHTKLKHTAQRDLLDIPLHVTLPSTQQTKALVEPWCVSRRYA